VAAVIEVKANLDKERLEEAANNIAVAKSLRKTPVPDLPFLVQWETLGCIFAFSSPLTLDKLAEHYMQSIRNLGGLQRHIDMIAVLDVGIIMLSAKLRNTSFWGPSLMFGPGGMEAEGSHIAIGATPYGEATLDVFLRMLLPHLTNFRGMSDHPGFNWAGKTTGQTKLTYLTSVTCEKDPEKKRQKLAQYRDEVIADFKQSAQPLKDT
jgi:hypothetical protein